MNQLEALIRRWDAEQSHILPPAQPEAVLLAFESAGQMATADVIYLYGRCGGMEQMDNNYWRLWPLSEIIQQNAERSKLGALFGDYLIDCWCYRLLPVNSEISAVYVDYFNGCDPVQVASSLEQFIDCLWRDPEELLERQLANRATSRA